MRRISEKLSTLRSRIRLRRTVVLIMDHRLLGAPGADELSLMLRGFLIRLSALDGQLEDNRGQLPSSICPNWTPIADM